MAQENFVPDRGRKSLSDENNPERRKKKRKSTRFIRSNFQKKDPPVDSKIATSKKENAKTGPDSLQDVERRGGKERVVP